MAAWSQELAADLVVLPGNRVEFENTSGGVSWLARCDGGTTAFQFNYTQWSNTLGNAATLSFRRYRGSAAVPLAVGANDFFGSFGFRGWDGAALIDTADFRCIAGPAWSSTAGARERGSRFTWLLTGGGEAGAVTGKTEVWRLTSDELRIRNGNANVFVFSLATTGGVQWGNTATQKQAWWGATPVVRDAGWGTPTGTLTKTTFDTATVTLPELAGRVGDLINTLKNLYGLLGA